MAIGRKAVLSLGILCIVPGCLLAGAYLQGTVRNPLGFPIQGAIVNFSGGGSDTTNTSGHFSIGFDFVSSSRLSGVAASGKVLFAGSRIRFDNLTGKRVAVSLFDMSGRSQVIVPDQKLGLASFEVNLAGIRPLASGAYLLRIAIDGYARTVRLTSVGSHLVWPQRELTVFHSESGSLRKIAAGTGGDLSASASGYQSRVFAVTQDTLFDIALTLYGIGLTVPAPVTTEETQETKDFTVATAWKTDYLSWFGGRTTTNFNNPSATTTVKRTYSVINLDNGLVRVAVAPGLGMRVLRVEDKSTGTSRQMFDIIDNPVLAQKQQDMGGVKPSFPFYEHGTSMDSAGYFIRKNLDGSVDVVMNMRFDYNQNSGDMGFLGKYGDRPLCGVVTLRPGENKISVRYIAQNPNPLRRNNRIWNDALYPVETPREMLFPTKWAIFHGATKIWAGLSATEQSQFALFAEYPFCGVYYSAVDANHLRIHDPVKCPGMKLFNGHVVEFWGSTNVLFEAPDTFVQAFEPVELRNDYFMARGIGKATYANDHVAIGVDQSTFKMTASSPAIVSVYAYGESTNPILADKEIGPATVLTGSFTTGLRVVSAGKELCNVKLPLEFADNKATYDIIKMKSQLSGGTGSVSGGSSTLDVNKARLDARWGYNYELEGIQNKWSMLSSLASLRAADSAKATDNAGVLLSIANTTYRHGGFGKTAHILQVAANASPEQANYLKALMALEGGQAADFSNTTLEGNYFKALQAIKSGNQASAVASLDALLAQRPNAEKPRLLRAYLNRDLADALRCVAIVPGSIEAWTVLKELGYPGASENLNGLLKQNGMAKTRSDDFVKEIKQGIWRHERRFEYTAEMFVSNQQAPFTPISPSPLPAFPASLEY